MTAFINIDDLETRFGADELLQLADRDGDGTVDDNVIATAIADANDVVVTYLSNGGYLFADKSDIPTTLTRAACDIARYYLWDDGASEAVEKRYESALKFLRKIADGSIDLITNSAIDNEPVTQSSSIVRDGMSRIDWSAY